MTLKIHIVQKGDTLWKIAQKYGANFEELKKMNSQLSNPDMIMPGMKIKVPTGGVPVTNEGNSLGIKEMPKVQHPYSDQSTKAYPVTEIDSEPSPTPSMQPMKKEMPIAPPPKKEAPVAPVAPVAPKKEMPKKEAPKKEVPKKEMPKKEAPKKEMPKMPKLPKIQPIAPEIDINNYYTLNMAMQQPKKEEPKVEAVVESPESPEMESIEAPVQQPCYPIVPISPVMPGCGFHYMPCYPPPMPPAYPAYPAYPQQWQMPQVQGEMESAESMENNQMVAGQMQYPNAPMHAGNAPMHAANAPFYPVMNPYMPCGPVQCSPCPPPWGYQQPAYPMYPSMPQVQGEMMESPEMENNSVMGMQMPYQPPQEDCGCGSPQPMPYGHQQMPYGYQQIPYGYQDQRLAPYPDPYGPPFGMIGAPPYPAVDPNLFNIPDYEEDED
ncbi:SafA/ExsA family spore coat assembly protein [Priestia flexa]|uniref:SafA/ExsA family spore coat assembly protein n=1 Tax=Priestia TaxID=2800373 RepID=UPI00288FA0C2|nr:SafA/ExsA family spore coat assembly protein [Priestia flexa]MDT2045333.1 SafA/ExsA family spore coat assembly protein [Priestia flexa]